MMKTTFFVLLISLCLTGCQFSKSVKKDLVSGMTTTGNGLSCDDVYLSVNDEKTDRSTFIYGEKFFLNFSDIKGFIKENESVFPGMNLFITSHAGDTIMRAYDLYQGYSDGIKLSLSPLLLTADLAVGSPIKSNGGYTLSIKIWDKKGKGIFNTKFNFTVKENERIAIESSSVYYDEIYIYSQERDKVITDNKIRFDENTYLIVEGISGFKEENDMVFPGLSMIATDSENNVIIENSDLFLNYSEGGVSSADLRTRVSSHFKLTGTNFKNPLHFEMTIWDKKSNAKIIAKTDMIVE